MFPPARVIFAGIGVLLLVGDFVCSFARALVMLNDIRRLKTSTNPKIRSSKSWNRLKTSSDALKFMLRSHQLLQ